MSLALRESFDLGSLCWLTFGRKSTVWQEISSRLDLMPKTFSLQEDAGKYQCITSKANNTLKASKVGHCASWSSWISCLQLWHKADPDLLIPIKQMKVTTRNSDLREPQPSPSDSQPASLQPVSETTTSESSVFAQLPT